MKGSRSRISASRRKSVWRVRWSGTERGWEEERKRVGKQEEIEEG